MNPFLRGFESNHTCFARFPSPNHHDWLDRTLRLMSQHELELELRWIRAPALYTLWLKLWTQHLWLCELKIKALNLRSLALNMNLNLSLSCEDAGMLRCLLLSLPFTSFERMIDLLRLPIPLFRFGLTMKQQAKRPQGNKRSAFFKNIESQKVRNFRENNAGLLYIETIKKKYRSLWLRRLIPKP